MPSIEKVHFDSGLLVKGPGYSVARVGSGFVVLALAVLPLKKGSKSLPSELPFMMIAPFFYMD